MKLKIKISTFLFIFLLSVTAFAQEDTYIVKFKDLIQLYGADSDPRQSYIAATWDEVQEYIEEGIVEYYEPNVEATLHTTTQTGGETTVSTTPWNLKNIYATFPKNIAALGNDIRVGVIDSGMNEYAAPGKIAPGYNFVDNTTDVTEPDNNIHGTVVGNIIAHYETGVATECNIVPLKCFYENPEGKYVSNSKLLTDAIYAAVNDYHCDVINMSFKLGTTTDEEIKTFKEAVDYAVSMGTILIASVGNDGNSSVSYPAAFDNVIGVGSVNEHNERSKFSQWNDSVFVTAPGEELPLTITTTAPSGTSFSAPHVSGLAAIAKCISPKINQEEFMQLLEKTSEDLGEKGKDIYYGYGLINCEAAIKKLIEGRKIYISPVTFLNVQVGDYIGRTSVATIYNNTQEPLTISVLYGQYNVDKTLIFAKIKQDATLSGGDYVPIPVPCPVGNAKYMVWDSLINMVPLTPSSFK